MGCSRSFGACWSSVGRASASSLRRHRRYINVPFKLGKELALFTTESMPLQFNLVRDVGSYREEEMRNETERETERGAIYITLLSLNTKVSTNYLNCFLKRQIHSFWEGAFVSWINFFFSVKYKIRNLEKMHQLDFPCNYTKRMFKVHGCKNHNEV